ncbi:Por secretion system C-terminal sorting domain-containing protein [Chitinophaga sp. CF118]|uniref:discoidin domain-containing protein n=1 Tax=Chitinophaga sp. CF118 TaxID=1884367 RepID=UPI0008E0C420|nr:discoidin domain-containing protein [Chitinophaga sp. CF118]SFD88202.1 Por secretion system C-terminal sorting domain-containing protein [Chitinophaga sp. CF118]
MQKTKLLFLFALMMLSRVTFAQLSCYNIVGYYPSWVAGGNYYINTPSKIDYSKYTHICYAFSIPDNNGNMGIDNASVLTDLVTRAHANNVKVLLSIGGWLSSSPSNTPFETIANSTTAINQLATVCGNLVTQYNLDGIDLDWEYPTTKTKWNNLATVLGTKLHGMGKLFTAAVSESASNNGDHYDNVTMLDLVNIMCYGGNNLASSSMSYWTSRGVPQSKRMLGVPFYSSDNTTAEHVWKSNLAKTTAGGIMIWDIATEYGDINSIYNTLGSICKGGTPVPQNLATNKPVTASSLEPNSTTSVVAANITDGNYSTRWSSAFADPQWVYVDLGASYDINRVKITWEAAYATAYEIQVSTDATTWTSVKSVTGNTTLVNDNTGLVGNGRYVRIYGTARATTYGYSIYELEVYGATSVSQTPYSGTASAIPGKIEAENYDNGGEGVAYHDLTSTNLGGQYRTTETVDLGTANEGGYNLGYVQAGEWVEYTVNITTAGAYTLQSRVAATAAGKSFHIELDGQNISGNISVPNTGDWQTYTTVSVTTPSLTTGKKVMRIVVDTAEFNLNWVNFTLQTSNSNIALNKTITASSVEEAGFEAAKAFDGNATTTRWSSAYTDNEWIAVDLGTAQNISRVVLKWENAYATSYRIETSTDNVNWTVQKTVTAGVGGTEDPSFPAVSARYVRMYGVTRATVYGYSIWEFEVYAAQPSSAKQNAIALSPVKTSLNESLVSIIVSPNPVKDVLTVKYKGTTSQSVLRIYSMTGQQTYFSKVSGSMTQIDVSKWPKGIYIISLGDARKKIVVE